jgi:hypothetical protein
VLDTSVAVKWHLTEDSELADNATAELYRSYADWTAWLRILMLSREVLR